MRPVRPVGTESQEQIILDAVRSGQRISVPAHSRGTIKTDLAVRNLPSS